MRASLQPRGSRVPHIPHCPPDYYVHVLYMYTLTYLPALPYLTSTVCLYAYTRVHMPHCLSCILPFNTQGMLD